MPRWVSLVKSTSNSHDLLDPLNQLVQIILLRWTFGHFNRLWEITKFEIFSFFANELGVGGWVVGRFQLGLTRISHQISTMWKEMDSLNGSDRNRATCINSQFLLQQTLDNRTALGQCFILFVAQNQKWQRGGSLVGQNRIQITETKRVGYGRQNRWRLVEGRSLTQQHREYLSARRRCQSQKR